MKNTAITGNHESAYFEEIPVDRLDPNPYQTRTEDKRSVDQLADSIRKFGLQQPPNVWPNGERWIICYGHQRVAAARSLGWSTILCRIESRKFDPASNH